MKGEKRFGRQNILRPKIFDHNFFIDQPGHAQSRWLERAHKTTHWKVFRNFFFFIEKYIWHVFMLLYDTILVSSLLKCDLQIIFHPQPNSTQNKQQEEYKGVDGKNNLRS